MPAILFVEEGKEKAQGRADEVVAEQPSFEVFSCANPEAALDLLQQGSFQCVVANFGDDAGKCTDFLHKVSDRAPEVLRLALLLPGKDEAMAFPEIEAANQTLSQGIPAADLVSALSDALKIAARNVQTPGLNQLLSSFSKLPSAPTLYFDLKELLNDPDSDNRQVARLIATDPVASARILKLANSAFYGLPRTVTEIDEAVMYLGTSLVSALVLTIHIYNQLPIPGFNMEALLKHGMTISALARQTARQLGCKGQEISAASTAGLLHDMGQLVFLSNLPERYFPLFRRAGNNENLLVELERQEFGVDHAELCAHLLSLWGLPEEVVEAVAGHHRSLDTEGGIAASAPQALRIAEWMMHTALNAPEDHEGRTAEPVLPDLPPQYEPIWKSCLDLVRIGTASEALL